MSKLIEASNSIRQATPELWQQLADALDDYAFEQISKMVQCPPEMLSRAQGMAIAATEIAQVVKEAPNRRGRNG